MNEVIYIDRRGGQRCTEKIFGHQALSFLYGGSLFSRIMLPLIARFPYASQLYGYLQRQEKSAKEIRPFIETYGIDESEFLESNFKSFNDFFIRKLKSECRPIVKNRLAMPADGRYLIYPQFDRFSIKGQPFSLKEFLQNSALANRYAEGSMAIARLCPSDYHRFHFPCDGIPSEANLINGLLYSVNPIALQKRISIFWENKRMITEIDSEEYGTILYIEIGATSVGSIHQTYTPDRAVQKGEEKGYFEFGASCIVLLFEKNRVQFDADLIENTKNGFETRANFGESLGISC
ncbi:MAG TPA: phosphatidylserine decarboxylase [Chlamydiales bacterium]|nr:phosphatidylserine decarboxylase [Chlamydiales bacterium]